MIDRYDVFTTSVWGAAGVAVVAAVRWIIRQVFINRDVADAASRSVEELRKEIALRAENRVMEHQAIERIEKGLEIVQADVKELFKRGA